ncbi:hypothetical protein [Salininema proteolyticum]|uniref:Helix-turn-helix domain-containing protein n=1 Tax=Salininema proteolyticum TaxID=1607685 RepID=A0ABV8TXE4_9ACTN
MNETLVAACRDLPVDGRAGTFLFALSTYADAEGRVPRTPNSLLAKAARMSVRTLQRAVADLVEAGLIVRHRRHNRPNAFTLLMDKILGRHRPLGRTATGPVPAVESGEQAIPRQPTVDKSNDAPAAERHAEPSDSPAALGIGDEPESAHRTHSEATLLLGERWEIRGDGLNRLAALVEPLTEAGWTAAALAKAVGERTDDVKHPFGVLKHRMGLIAKRRPPRGDGETPRRRYTCWTCGVPTEEASHKCRGCAEERPERKKPGSRRVHWREIADAINSVADDRSAFPDEDR